MKGRKPKPPGLRLIQGNPGKRPIREVPKVEIGDATPPAFLKRDAEALRYWHQTVPHLIKLEILTKLNKDLYARGCQFWSLSATPDRRVTFEQRRKSFTLAFRIFQSFGGTPVEMVRLAKKPLKESPGTKWGGTLA